MSKKTGTIRKCLTCGKEFYAPGWSIKKGFSKFCSLNCRRKTSEEKERMSLLRLGKSAWNKGLTKAIDKRLNYNRPTLFKSQGKCKLNEILRHSYRYRQWRSDVFTRDNFTCQECGQWGGRLQAHHIKSLSTIMQYYEITTLEEAFECEELWNINNGITFCKECHKKTDSYLNKGMASLAFA